MIEYIFNKVCPAILIIQVVGMFPDIHREDRLQPVGYGCVRIGGRDNPQFLTVKDQPGPTTSKLAFGRL